MAYHTTTQRANVPLHYEEVTPGRHVNTERQTTGSTTKRAIVPPYYTSGRQVNTELKEGEPEYDYPVIEVNREVQADDHQYEQPM